MKAADWVSSPPRAQWGPEVDGLVPLPGMVLKEGTLNHTDLHALIACPEDRGSGQEVFWRGS